MCEENLRYKGRQVKTKRYKVYGKKRYFLFILFIIVFDMTINKKKLYFKQAK